MIEEIRYPHNTQPQVFLGQFDEFDLWFFPDLPKHLEVGYSIGWDETEPLMKRFGEAVDEARRRAIERKLMEPPVSTILYFLQNQSAGYLGNSPMWWKKGGNGYTDNVDDAQEFSEVEADEIINSTKSSHDFKKWPTPRIFAVAYRTVDIQRLR